MIPEPRVLIVCDASPAQGLGHLRRVAVLAEALAGAGARVYFGCRASGLDWAALLPDCGGRCHPFSLACPPGEEAWAIVRFAARQALALVVIDHYRADAAYQQALAAGGVRWLQFDWAARDPLWADWVLNANPAASPADYRPLLRRPGARLLLGPAYALLRPEFRVVPPRPAQRTGAPALLLSFGGGDDRGAALFCLQALEGLEPALTCLILTGSVNPSLPALRRWAADHPATARLLVDERAVAARMAEADLALIAGGATSFEAARMGLPGIIIQIADNQAPNARAWEAHGAALDLGRLDTLRAEDVRAAVGALLQDPARRAAMAAAGQRLVDGQGAGRIARILLHTHSEEL